MDLQPKLTSAKDILAIVRESAIVIAVIVLVLCPGAYAWWSAKFDEEAHKRGASKVETGIAGNTLTFDHSTETVDKLVTANKTIDDLKLQLQNLIASAPGKTAEQAKQIQNSANVLSSQIQSSLNSAKTVQLSQDPVQDAPGLATGSGTYGIVVSADKKDDLAAYEAQLLKRENFNDVAFYDRLGFIRTVARFADATAANEALPSIQKTRQGAYIINLSKWCPKYTDERVLAGVPVLQCQ
jgi:hypothetical protein